MLANLDKSLLDLLEQYAQVVESAAPSRLAETARVRCSCAMVSSDNLVQDSVRILDCIQGL